MAGAPAVPTSSHSTGQAGTQRAQPSRRGLRLRLQTTATVPKAKHEGIINHNFCSTDVFTFDSRATARTSARPGRRARRLSIMPTKSSDEKRLRVESWLAARKSISAAIAIGVPQFNSGDKGVSAKARTLGCRASSWPCGAHCAPARARAGGCYRTYRALGEELVSRFSDTSPPLAKLIRHGQP